MKITNKTFEVSDPDLAFYEDALSEQDALESIDEEGELPCQEQ